MSTYRVKTGTDEALNDLTVLSPQPDPGTGIRTTRRSVGGDNTVEFFCDATATPSQSIGKIHMDSNNYTDATEIAMFTFIVPTFHFSLSLYFAIQYPRVINNIIRIISNINPS